MKLISLILLFKTILLQLVDKVTHEVHFHSFYGLPYEVYYKYNDLCWPIIYDMISIYKLKI